MKSKNPQRQDGLINPDSFKKKEKGIRKIKRIPGKSSGLIERQEDRIVTEEGKDLLNEEEI